MKLFKNLSLVIGIIGALTLISGCGGSGSKDNAVAGPAYPNYNGGIVTALPNGGAQVTFSGQNVSANSSYVQGSTQDFNPGWPGTITLGNQGQTQGGFSSQAYGGVANCNYGVNAQGSTVQLTMMPTNFGVANVTGAVNLTPAFIQYAFGSNVIPNLLGLYVDLHFSGSGIYSGSVLFCTSKDAQGYCHGGKVGFKQGTDCQY